uniref:WH2 domain-containing protein n=1 Tax=Bursaphelenchus xylophilus TaxID=6326 RepID=A0A1I7RNH9_BURXY
MRCRDVSTSESEEENDFTPISYHYSVNPVQKSNNCRVTEVSEPVEKGPARPKTLSPLPQNPNSFPRATIATGPPRLTADERVRQRSKPPPSPPVNQKAIPRVVAFGRTTKLEDTIHAKTGRFNASAGLLNRAMSASTFNLHHHNVPHTLSAQVQTLQQLVDELSKKVTSQDKKIEDLKSTVSHMKENQVNTCKDIVTTTKSLRGLSERCLKNEKDVDEMNKIISKLSKTTKIDPVKYVSVDGEEEIPVIDLKGSAREGRLDVPEASFLELEDRLKREENGLRSGLAGSSQSKREQRFYAEKHVDNSKENQEPNSARSVTHAFYYVQREEVHSPSPRTRPPTRHSEMFRRYPELPARNGEKLGRPKSYLDKNGTVDYTPSMKKYLDKTKEEDSDLDRSLESYRPKPQRVKYEEERLDDIDEATYVSMVARNVDDRRRYKNGATRNVIAGYNDITHGESLDSEIPDNFQTYKSRYHH